MLNRQRVRKPATWCGVWPAASRLLASSASSAATSRVTRALARLGSRLSGSVHSGFQALADGGVGQLLQPDAVAARVGKRRVGGAGAGELGVQLDDVAHVHHHHEGRAALGGRQRAGVVLGLGAGAQQRVVEGAGGRGAAGLRLDAGFQLLALPDEVAAPVAVDAAGAGAAVAVGEGDGPLEHVALLGRGVRRLHAQQLAELDDEALRGGQLRGGDAAPALDEGGRAGGLRGAVVGGRCGAVWCGVSHRRHHSERARLAPGSFLNQ